MSKPSDHPVRWCAGFGWGWRGFWHLMFPPNKKIPGYVQIKVKGAPLWMWPWSKLKRLNWAIRGPL